MTIEPNTILPLHAWPILDTFEAGGGRVAHGFFFGARPVLRIFGSQEAATRVAEELEGSGLRLARAGGNQMGSWTVDLYFPADPTAP